MPRPSLEAIERRSKYLTLRVTPAELQRLHDQATEAGVAFSDFARRRVLDGKVVVKQSRQLAPAALAEVRRIGLNVNQIARRLNGEPRIHPSEVAGVRGQLLQLLELLEVGADEPGR